MAAVLVVCQGVLPALPGPLMAHEADEGRAPDDVGGGGGAQKSVVRLCACGGVCVFITGEGESRGYCVCVCLLLVGGGAYFLY